MKRYHEELARTRREHRRHLRLVHDWLRRPVECVCDFQAGRFRKRDAFDCGVAACLVCHYEKVFGVPSHKDLVRALRADDSLTDACDWRG